MHINRELTRRINQRITDSKKEESAQTVPEGPPSEILAHVEKWKEGASKDELLTRLAARGVEVKSTKITGELLNKFANKEAGVDSSSIFKFLEEITGCDLGWIEEEEDVLRAASKVLLESGNVELVTLLLMENASLLKEMEDFSKINQKGVLEKLAANPDLLQDRELLIKLFVNTLAEHPDLLKEHALFIKILGFEDPSALLKVLADNSDLFKDRDLSLKILKSNDPLSILKDLEKYSDLLNDRELLIVTLGKGNVMRILQLLDKHPELPKDRELFVKILNCRDPLGVLLALDRHSELSKDRELLLKILASEHPSGILEALGKNSELLEERYRGLLFNILKSENPSGILEGLGKNSKLLDKEYRGLLETILQSEHPSGVLAALAKNSELLTERYREFLMTILKLKNPSGILEALVRNPELLEEGYHDLLWTILKFENSAGILMALGKNFEVLKNRDLLVKILGSVNPLGVLVALNENPILLEDKYSELLVKILKSENPSDILETLGSYTEILNNPNQREQVLLARDPADKAKSLHYRQFVTISPEGYSGSEDERPAHMNRDLFIDDPNLGEWNTLIQREGNISDEEWDQVKNLLGNIFDGVFEEKKLTRKILFKFLTQCMSSSTTDTDIGHQNIKKRVEAVVNVLNKYFKEFNNPDTSDARKKDLKDIIQQALNKMATGGSSCPDLAVVCLREAETHLKVFAHPAYIANIFVNMFKMNAIMDKLIDKDYNEYLESFLNYTILFNSILGLGVTGGMLFQNLAEKIALDKALQILSTAFTAKELIDFTAELPEFRILFEKEKEAAIFVKNEELGDAINDRMDLKTNTPEYTKQQAKIDQLEVDVNNLKKSFYADKARQLFLNAGFLVEEE